MSANKVTVSPTTNTITVSSPGTVGPQGGTGAAGSDGINGYSAHVGTGAPSNSLGAVNDLFFDNQNYILYKKTGSTTWTSQGSYATTVGNNTFSTITVPGQSNVVADSSTDTLNLAAGSNVTLTTNAGTDTITVASTDTTANENITLSGDVTGSGTTGISATLANSGVSAGTYGSGTLIPAITVDAKGRVTGVTTNNVSSAAGGTVSSVAVSGSDGIQVDSGSPVTSSGTIALGVDKSAMLSHLNVADGAEVNVQADWNASSGDAQIVNKPTLATVATSGSYNDLSNKPTVPSGNIVDDTSPQLGGNLDINGQDIVSTSNANIELDPNGSGKVVFKGNSTKGAGQFVLNCENNSHGIIIKGPPHSASASYTLTLPNNDGDSGQFLKTDGSGNLSWSADNNTTYSVQDGELSQNNFTNTLKTKLDNIADNAEVNVQANWNEASSSSDAYIQNKPSLFTEAEAIALAIAL